MDAFVNCKRFSLENRSFWAQISPSFSPEETQSDIDKVYFGISRSEETYLAFTTRVKEDRELSAKKLTGQKLPENDQNDQFFTKNHQSSL